MVRHFPSIFLNSDLDEAAVVWTCAHRQRQVAARRKLRDVVFGALFALFGIVFTAVALLTQVESSVELSTLGYLLVAGGLVVLLGGIIMIIYTWATDPGAVAGLVKGYWRLIALPYSQSVILLWDTLATAHASVVMFDLDAERLRDLTKSIPADFLNSAEEHRFLTTMRQLVDSLKQVQAQAYRAAFFPRGTAPGHSLAALLVGTSPAPTPLGTDHFVLPSAEDLDVESLKSFVEKVAQFLEVSQPVALDAVKESVVSHSQLALQALSAIAKEMVTTSEAFKKGASARSEMKGDLSEALDELFTPVLNELEEEAKAKLNDLEARKNESIEKIKTRYAWKADQIQSESADQLRSLDFSIQQCKMRMDEANQNLAGVKDEARKVGQDLNGESVSVDPALGPDESRIATLGSSGDAGVTQSSSSAEELREQPEREQMLSALQARLVEARANVKNAQEQYQQLGAERDRVAKEFEQRVQACFAERDVEIKNYEADREQLRQETLRHIREIQADKDKLSSLLQQGLDDLSPLEPAALQEGHDQHLAAPLDPFAAAEAILEYRTRGIESLRDQVLRVVEALVERRRLTEQVVRGYCWEAANVEEGPGEYLIPFWFVRYERQRHWRPFLGMCDLSSRGIRPGEQLGLRVDDARSRPLLDYMSSQLGSDYLDAVLSPAFAANQTEAKERLLGELQKMQRWNLIGVDLFEEIQAQFERTDEAKAQTQGASSKSLKQP